MTISRIIRLVKRSWEIIMRQKIMSDRGMMASDTTVNAEVNSRGRTSLASCARRAPPLKWTSCSLALHHSHQWIFLAGRPNGSTWQQQSVVLERWAHFTSWPCGKKRKLFCLLLFSVLHTFSFLAAFYFKSVHLSFSVKPVLSPFTVFSSTLCCLLH